MPNFKYPVTSEILQDILARATHARSVEPMILSERIGTRFRVQPPLWLLYRRKICCRLCVMHVVEVSLAIVKVIFLLVGKEVASLVGDVPSAFPLEEVKYKFASGRRLVSGF